MCGNKHTKKHTQKLYIYSIYIYTMVYSILYNSQCSIYIYYILEYYIIYIKEYYMLWHNSTALQAEPTHMQIVKPRSLFVFFLWSQILLMAWPLSHDQSPTLRMMMTANRGAEVASSSGFLKVVARETVNLFEASGVQLRSHPGYA